MSKEQVIELDEATAKEIAKHVVTPEVNLDDLADKIASRQEKELNKVKGAKKSVEGEVVSRFEKLDKEMFAAEQYKAWVSGDKKALKELNNFAINTYKEKSIHQVAATADGGAIVPSRELLTDVFSTLEQYSEVAADLRVITLDAGTGIDVATLLQDVVITEVGSEGGAKDVTKLVFGDGHVDVREFAGIAVMTKKLVRQAAVNIYDLLRDSFARAIATKRAQVALTDATSGIVNKAGVVEVEASGDTVEDVTWEDVKKMPYAVPVSVAEGGKYYISRALLEQLDLATDKNDRSLELVRPDAGRATSGTFKNGYRFSVEEGLGVGEVPHAVFGNMSRYGILVRQGTVETDTFDSGTVPQGEVTHDLISENKLAQRVAFYENVGYPIENAFAVLVPAES